MTQKDTQSPASPASSSTKSGEAISQAEALSQLKARIHEAQSSLSTLEQEAASRAPHDARGRSSSLRPLMAGMLFTCLLLILIGAAAFIAYEMGKGDPKDQASDGSTQTPSTTGNDLDLTIKPAGILPDAVPADYRSFDWYEVGREYFAPLSTMQVGFGDKLTSIDFAIIDHQGAFFTQRVREGENLPLRAQVKMRGLTNENAQLAMAGRTYPVAVQGTKAKSNLNVGYMPPREGGMKPTGVKPPKEMGALPTDPRIPAEGDSAKVETKEPSDSADSTQPDDYLDPTSAIIAAQESMLLEMYGGLASEVGPHHHEPISRDAWQQYLFDFLDSCVEQCVMRSGLDELGNPIGALVARLSPLEREGMEAVSGTTNLLSSYGIEPGAIIVEFQDKKIRTAKDFEQTLRTAEIHKEIRLAYILPELLDEAGEVTRASQICFVWVVPEPESKAKAADADKAKE